MGHAREVNVVESLARLIERRHEHRMPMTVQDRPPRRNCIDDLAAIGQMQELVLGAGADERRFRFAERAVGMPNDLSISFNDAHGQMLARRDRWLLSLS